MTYGVRFNVPRSSIINTKKNLSKHILMANLQKQYDYFFSPCIASGYSLIVA